MNNRIAAALARAQARRRDFSCLVHDVFGSPPASKAQALRDAECALEREIFVFVLDVLEEALAESIMSQETSRRIKALFPPDVKP